MRSRIKSFLMSSKRSLVFLSMFLLLFSFLTGNFIVDGDDTAKAVVIDFANHFLYLVVTKLHRCELGDKKVFEKFDCCIELLWKGVFRCLSHSYFFRFLKCFTMRFTRWMSTPMISRIWCCVSPARHS